MGEVKKEDRFQKQGETGNWSKEKHRPTKKWRGNWRRSLQGRDPPGAIREPLWTGGLINHTHNILTAHIKTALLPGKPPLLLSTVLSGPEGWTSLTTETHTHTHTLSTFSIVPVAWKQLILNRMTDRVLLWDSKVKLQKRRRNTFQPSIIAIRLLPCSSAHPPPILHPHNIYYPSSSCDLSLHYSSFFCLSIHHSSIHHPSHWSIRLSILPTGWNILRIFVILAIICPEKSFMFGKVKSYLEDYWNRSFLYHLPSRTKTCFHHNALNCHPKKLKKKRIFSQASVFTCCPCWQMSRNAAFSLDW